ncbi:MAG: hypothetical protein AAGA03_03630 [Planctomycetota bacterium]
MPTGESNWQASIRRNTIWLGIWTGSWVLTSAVAAFSSKLLGDSSRWLTMVAIAVNLLVGMGMILANRTYLRGLDEHQRRIHTDAMGLTLGVGLVVGISYSLLDITNVIAPDAEIPLLIALMGLVFLGSLVVATRHYR